MRRDASKQLKSTFLSCEKDTELILRKLFIDNAKYSEELKRLLVINTPDCLRGDTPAKEELYKSIIGNMSIHDLIEEQYIKIAPKLIMAENEEMKSYIILSYDNFSPSGNLEFRDCLIHFDIVCPIDQWKMGDYAIRPLKIAGYIDGLLNNQKLTGIGELQFGGCNELILNENLGGYTISYLAIHQTRGDDSAPPLDE